MKKKYIYFLIIAICVLLLAYYSINIKINIYEANQQNSSTFDVKKQEPKCDTYDDSNANSITYEKLNALSNECLNIFVEKAGFFSFNSKAILSDKFRKYLLEHTNLSTHTKLMILNDIVPVEIAMSDHAFVLNDREYLKKVIQNNGYPDRYLAITVLGYYKDDSDLSIFEHYANSGIADDLAASVFSVVLNCSPKAKNALRRIVKSDSFSAYLRKYKSKETLTNLIERDCNIGLVQSETKSEPVDSPKK